MPVSDCVSSACIYLIHTCTQKNTMLSKLFCTNVVIFGFHFHRSCAPCGRHITHTHICPGTIKINVVNRSSLMRNAEWKQQQQQITKWIKKKKSNERKERKIQKIVKTCECSKPFNAFRKRCFTIVSVEELSPSFESKSDSHAYKIRIFHSFFVFSMITWRIEWKGNENKDY